MWYAARIGTEMSFHLVDRIHEFRPEKGARGSLQIPADAEDFPLSLVVEAVGQLASYIAMASADFSMRPVAAIAGEVIAHRTVSPGDLLELEVNVGALRASAMRYGGSARVGGDVAVELRRCTGAMLPMDAFDDPASVRELMRQLQTTGAPPRGFPARTEFAPRVLKESHELGRATATLEAPERASFYADHFPRRPVYPATLLLDAKIRVAQRLAAGSTAPDSVLPEIRAVRSVKVRAFTPPGGRIDVVVAEGEADEDARQFEMEAFADEARVSTATVSFDSRTL